MAAILRSLVLLSLLAACARDSEAALRARLDRWFFIERLIYFESKPRCTAAVYRVLAARPRPELRIATDTEDARAALAATGRTALRIEDHSPHDLTEALLLSGSGAFGKQALHAGALARPCLDSDARAGAALFEALTRPGATLAYEAENGGVMILDEARMRLIYIAGDIW